MNGGCARCFSRSGFGAGGQGTSGATEDGEVKHGRAKTEMTSATVEDHDNRDVTGRGETHLTVMTQYIGGLTRRADSKDANMRTRKPRTAVTAIGLNNLLTGHTAKLTFRNIRKFGHRSF